MTKPKMPGEDQLIRGQQELAAGLKDIYSVFNNYLTTQIITVTPGDTLWHLAATHLGSGQRWREIMLMNLDRLFAEQDAHNALASRQDMIYPGTQICVLAF